MYCVNCGQKLQDVDSFCSRCGTSRNGIIPPREPQPTYNNATISYPRRTVDNNTTQLYGFLLSLFILGWLGVFVGVAGLNDCQFYDKKGKAFSIFNIVFGMIIDTVKLLILAFLISYYYGV